jgi:predicted nucleotidyltransferase component of viral defense system
MLQYSTVEPGTLELLRELMAAPIFEGFVLVGGTNLSLRYGHRISDDIDLFSPKNFDNEEIMAYLSNKYPADSTVLRSTSIGIFANIKGVKLHIIKNHHHPLIYPIEVVDEIRLFDARNIAAMKISTVLRRAHKKDFFDIKELLKYYSLSDIIEFYVRKYPEQQLLISIPQALIYFSDADESQNPRSLDGATWGSVKTSIQKTVSNYLK